MAEPISIQQLKDASEDAISLAEFINEPENVMIPRRLASDINSLQYYLEYMKSFAQRSYETYDEMVANASNLSENVSVFVTNDSDTSKNGIYTYNGTSFVRGEYQPENVAKDYVEAKLGGLQVFDGKVRAQDVSTSDGSTQDAKNLEFRNKLDALPFEGGVLADTFVVVDDSLSQWQLNRGLESIADLSTIINPKDGLRVYVKSYHAGLGKGGGYFTYDSSKADDNLTGILVNGWERVNETHGVYYLDWILPDEDIADVSLYTSEALSVLSQLEDYHTLYCEGSFKFENTLGTLTEGNELKGGTFTAQNDLTAEALTVTGEAFITGTTIDVNEFQCASTGIVHFRNGGGVVSNCDIGNVKNISAAEPFGNIYGIFSRGTTTYDLLVKDSYIHDVYALGDNNQTQYGFCGGIFLYVNSNFTGYQKLEVVDSTLEKFKTIFVEGATPIQIRGDNDSDALRVYCESTLPDINDRLHLISRNNTFNYCSKRFYKTTNCSLYASNDRSYRYYTDIEMNNISQSTYAHIENCSYIVNLASVGVYIFEGNDKNYDRVNQIRNVSIVNYLPEDPNDTFPPVGLDSRGTVALCHSNSSMFIKDVHVENLSGIYRAISNTGSPNLTVDGISGSTLGIFLHWSNYAGTRLSVSNVDLNFRGKVQYITNSKDALLGRNQSVRITTYEDGSPFWAEGVSIATTPITYWSNVTLKDIGFSRSTAYSGTSFLPITMGAGSKVVMNNFNFLADNRLSSFIDASSYFDGASIAHLNNCIIDSVVAIRDITDTPLRSTVEVINSRVHSLLLAGDSKFIRKKNVVETALFASDPTYNEYTAVTP